MTKKGTLQRLLAIMVLDHTSLNLTFPLFALLFFDLQSPLFTPDTSTAIRATWYGVCLAIPHIMVLFSAPLMGGLSDKYGRKPLLFLGMLAAALFSLMGGIAVLTSSLILLCISRVIQGLFSRTNPIAQAIIGDLGEKDRKVVRMAYLQFSISFGAFIGPVLGGYFVQNTTPHYALPFFVATLIAVIGIFITYKWFSETLTQKTDTASFTFYAFMKILKNPQVRSISLLLLLCQLGWSLYYQFIPAILKTQFHATPKEIGWFVGMIAFWLALATLVGVPVMKKYLSTERLLSTSILLVFIGLLLTVFSLITSMKSLLWFSAIPVAMGDVIAYSCFTALYSDSVPIESQGKVMGVCFIIVSIVWACTGFFGGILMSYYTAFPLIIAPIFLLLLLLFLPRYSMP